MSMHRDVETYDLIIVGAGSGNRLPGPEMESWQIAIVEPNKFGGMKWRKSSTFARRSPKWSNKRFRTLT